MFLCWSFLLKARGARDLMLLTEGCIYIRFLQPIIEGYVKQVCGMVTFLMFKLFFLVRMILHLFTIISIFLSWKNIRIQSWFLARHYSSGQRWKPEVAVRRSFVLVPLTWGLHIRSLRYQAQNIHHIHFGMRQSLGKDSSGFPLFSLGQQKRNFKP